MTPDAFEARTLSLSRHGNTRGREWWRGFCYGLLTALAGILTVIGALAYVTRP